MAIALISNVAGGAPTSAIDTTGANFLIAEVSYYPPFGSATISDSYSNTWTQLNSYTAGGASVASTLFYVLSPTVGTGHTFSCGPNVSNVAVAAFSGVATSSAFDQQNGSSGVSSTSSLQTGSVTPTFTNELIITGLAASGGGSPTVDSGFTITDTYTNLFTTCLGYVIQTSIVSENPTWSFSNGSFGCAASIATFQGSGGGGGTTWNVTPAYLGTNSVFMGDSTKRQATNYRKPSDSVCLLDQIQRQSNPFRKTSDSVFLLDQPKRQSTANRKAQDSVFLLDQTYRQATGNRKASDNVYLGDSVKRLVSYSRSVLDGAYLLDQTKRQCSPFRKVLDNVYLADTVKRSAVNYRKVSDSVFLADLATCLGAGTHFIHLIDSIFLADSTNRLCSPLRKVIDTIYLNDLVHRQVTALRKASDTVYLGDKVARQASISRLSSDNVFLGDSVKRTASGLRQIFDAVYLADRVSRQATAYRLVRDTVFLNDLGKATLPTILAAVIYIIRAHYSPYPTVICGHYSANPTVIQGSRMYPIQENRRVPRGSGVEAWNLTLNPPPISGGYSNWVVVYQVTNPANGNAKVFQQTLTLIDAINGVWQQTFTSANTASTGPMPNPTYNEWFWRTDQSPNNLLLRFGQLQLYGDELEP